MDDDKSNHYLLKMTEIIKNSQFIIKAHLCNNLEMLIKFNYDYWREFQMTPFVKTLLKIIVLIISGDIKI